MQKMNFPCFSFFIALLACLVSVGHSNSVLYPKPGTSRFKQNGKNYAPPKPQPVMNMYKIMSRSTAKFALALNFLLMRGNKEANLVFSPLNIIQTLSTLMLGTGGITERELANILGISMGHYINDRKAVHKSISQFLRSVADHGNSVEGLRVMMANAVFIQAGYPVKESFTANARNYYSNDVIHVDFENGVEASKRLNQWVSEKTEGKIQTIADSSLDPTTKVIVAGTLYFNGNWEYPFFIEATKLQKFYLTKSGKLNKTSVEVEMMVNQAEIPYYIDRSRGFQAIGMPYKNKEFYMYIVLPNLEVDLGNLTTCLTPKDIEAIVENSKLSEVFYVIPKMKIDTEYNLRTPLEILGVKSMFNPYKANFTDLADNISASDILHKVTIDVNEVGTIAAAATSSFLNRGGFINFRADRPFFFFIYNVKMGTMIFWGKVHKPTPFK